MSTAAEQLIRPVAVMDQHTLGQMRARIAQHLQWLQQQCGSLQSLPLSRLTGVVYEAVQEVRPRTGITVASSKASSIAIQLQ
jgi:hypothetical protein